MALDLLANLEAIIRNTRADADIRDEMYSDMGMKTF
jgi:hypothetical protein